MTSALARKDFNVAGSPTSSYSPVTERMRALIVDDDRTLREGCASVLRAEGINVEVTARGEEAIQMIHRSRFDIMLVDVYLEPVSGIDVLKAVMATAPSTLVVLMTGNPSVDSSIEAMRIGAWDYLPKPYSGTQLQLLVGRAAHAVTARRERETPSGDSLALGTEGSLLLGTSPAFKNATELARRAAPTNASVMIVGETGTGKEVIAQYIHQHSRRARKRLVPINCAAIPEQLLESEMFGHRKGAFTGADREKMGLLELANGGTLFLDELTEMSMALQAKMLRVLQDGIVRRVGSEEEDAVADVRFVSATHRLPLDQEVDLGAVSNGVGILPSSDAYHVAKEQVLATFEKNYVTRLVARASGNMSRAARLASVDRTTLYRLLERHGFRRDLGEASMLAFPDGAQQSDEFVPKPEFGEVTRE